MPASSRKIFAVIGAGPKGLAVAVKAKVLSEMGLSTDRVVLIERHQVAAHWSGEFGYTDGEMKLGTSPEKDVVFPMHSDVEDPLLRKKILRRLGDFTWNSFLVQTNRFSDWIDRGRPSPCHQMWAQYLLWVSKQLAPEVTMITAELAGVDVTPDRSQWILSLKSAMLSIESLTVDRLMLTGPGQTRMDFDHRTSDFSSSVYDLETFWCTLKKGLFPSVGRLAIVGAGENAAAVLLAVKKFAPSLSVEIVSPKGFVSTRAENFYENRFYSQPEQNGWNELGLEDRADFISRTDLGVFSGDAMRALNDETQHRIIPGRVIGLSATAEGLRLTLRYGQKISMPLYDHMILATGFDQMSTIKSLFSRVALDVLSAATGNNLDQTAVALRIGKDLSVEGLFPALHLPMLATLRQGPGFANLSCLGLLSDRVLLNRPAEAQRLASENAFCYAEAAP